MQEKILFEGGANGLVYHSRFPACEVIFPQFEKRHPSLPFPAFLSLRDVKERAICAVRTKVITIKHDS